jgi:glutathione synthase/RimK-type ligase-like ATP-grasp enzyme
MTLTQHQDARQAGTPFLGLAPFLRMSIAGVEMLSVAREMLAKATLSPDDANLWMNLSIVTQCVGQRELGLALQAQALACQRIYHLRASEQPVKLRLLMLMVPGDLAANTPLECLLELSDIDLDFYYVTPGNPLAVTVPEHDVLLVALSETDENRELLLALTALLAHWPKPVVNAPQYIPSTGRAAASALLQNVPGLLIPPTLRAARPALQAIAAGSRRLAEVYAGCDFPIILRPLGSHGGHDLDKIEHPEDLANYLARVAQPEFYLSRFIDYSSPDGFFRKMRVALIAGESFACHMAISRHWMIHYVNAGMYEEAWKREEELAFMTHFDDFVARHHLALNAIAGRTRLDYLCIDCAQTPEGELLVFEIDHAMVVHAMDTEEQFPYKQIYMQKVKNALRDYLIRLTRPQKTARTSA